MTQMLRVGEAAVRRTINGTVVDVLGEFVAFECDTPGHRVASSEAIKDAAKFCSPGWPLLSCRKIISYLFWLGPSKLLRPKMARALY